MYIYFAKKKKKIHPERCAQTPAPGVVSPPRCVVRPLASRRDGPAVRRAAGGHAENLLKIGGPWRRGLVVNNVVVHNCDRRFNSHTGRNIFKPQHLDFLVGKLNIWSHGRVGKNFCAQIVIIAG